jgi:hypothetical protein
MTYIAYRIITEPTICTYRTYKISACDFPCYMFQRSIAMLREYRLKLVSLKRNKAILCMCKI